MSSLLINPTSMSNGRAFVELEIATTQDPSEKICVRVHHDDEAEDVEQRILSIQSPPSSSRHLSTSAQRCIHEAILDATRMELVQTAHERDHRIDGRLQRYRFLKQRNRSLHREVKTLQDNQQHRKRYALDIISPTRPTILRQVAVESQRRELGACDRLRDVKSLWKQEEQKRLNAESRIRVLEAQMKAHRRLDLRHAAGGADIGKEYSNARYQSQQFVLQGMVEQLECEKLVLEKKVCVLNEKVSKLEKEKNREKRTRIATERNSVRIVSEIEKSRDERQRVQRHQQQYQQHQQHHQQNQQQHKQQQQQQQQQPQPQQDIIARMNADKNGDSQTSPGGTPFQRIKHVEAHHEIATLKEELRRVLLEFDQTILDDQTIIARLKDDNLRLQQLSQRKNWKKTDELD